MSVGVVLLAAGGSTRMGRAKQSLPFRGTTLLRHAATAAAESGLVPAVVVLGARAGELEAELRGLPVAAVVNPEWESGLSASIRAGLTAALAADPRLEAVVLTLADLPAVTPELLAALARRHRDTGAKIVACRYADAAGVPALFARVHFPELLQLPDASGAKRLIAAAGADVEVVDFPGGAADIDTPADYARLMSEKPDVLHPAPRVTPAGDPGR